VEPACAMGARSTTRESHWDAREGEIMTMSRTRLIKLSLLAVLATSAIASASASAAAETETRFFVEGKEVTETVGVDGAIGLAQINTTLAGTHVQIPCDGTRIITMKMLPNGKTEVLLEYVDCYVYEITKGKRTLNTACQAEHRETVYWEDRLIRSPFPITEDEFVPISGKVLFEFPIQGSLCALKGTYPVEGSYVASWGDEGEVEKTEHELKLTSTGSSTTFGGEPASLTMRAGLKLTNGKPWRV
jgi:hypothetical protein